MEDSVSGIPVSSQSVYNLDFDDTQGKYIENTHIVVFMLIRTAFTLCVFFDL